MAILAWQLAWLARFNFIFPYPDFQLGLRSIPIIIVIQSIIFWRFNLYRGVWRFASLPDLWNILRAAVLGALSITLVLFILFRLEGIPRSILIFYPIFLILLLGAPRLGYRFWKDHTLQHLTVSHSIRVLIIGAGRAGAMLAHDMLRDGEYLPVGFLDDNPRLRDSEIHGIRVQGRIENITAVNRALNPSIIIIAIPSCTDEQMQRIASLCEETKLPVRTLPKLTDMISGRPILDSLHDLSVEDLLGRDKVELDWGSIQDGIVNRIIMVTGGGGYIGSELCRQISGLAPNKLIIFEQSEYNLYKIQREIKESHPALDTVFVLGDICDEGKINYTVREYNPDIIFHAAAYKHVPILEKQCREAIRNNILGTLIVANAAIAHQCEKFVLISTDKAVKPENILGKTKRISEIICKTKNNLSRTRFVTVRFGNVLGSDGSVLPLFREQVNKGGPLTVTHPEVTRYFMTNREACQLILQACVMGKGGEIFVLDMGKPVKISFLAEQLIKLSGAVPGVDINLDYIGLRPGEKLMEELFHPEEQQVATSHEKILLAKYPDINADFINEKILDFKKADSEYDENKLRKLLHDTINGIQYENEKKMNIISLKKQ